MSSIDDEIAELRTRLAQLEARKAAEAIKPPPPVATIVGEPPRETDTVGRRLTIAIVVAVGLAVALGVLASLQLKASPPPPPVQAWTPPPPPAPLQPTAPPTPQSAWTYSEDVDAMSDRKTRTACVDSTDTVNLDWPYKAVTAELCIRNSPKFGFDVFFQLNGDGQILCDSYNGCSAKIRYGDAPAGRNGALTAADHSSNVIFLTGARNVAARLAKAKTTRIELTYYQAGSQAVSFPTEGLELSKIGLGGAGKKKD